MVTGAGLCVVAVDRLFLIDRDKLLARVVDLAMRAIPGQADLADLPLKARETASAPGLVDGRRCDGVKDERSLESTLDRRAELGWTSVAVVVGDDDKVKWCPVPQEGLVSRKGVFGYVKRVRGADLRLDVEECSASLPSGSGAVTNSESAIMMM